MDGLPPSTGELGALFLNSPCQHASCFDCPSLPFHMIRLDAWLHHDRPGIIVLTNCISSLFLSSKRLSQQESEVGDGENSKKMLKRRSHL